MPPAPNAAPVLYDLIISDGERRLRWSFRDHGVSVEADRLRVMLNGAIAEIMFADIAGVTLSLASTGGAGAVALCNIGLRSGARVVVSTMKASGLGDPAKAGIYRRFIEEFHHKLVASGDADHISFRQGFSAGRRTVLLVSLLAGTVMFIGLPLLGLFILREVKSLFVLIAGAGLLLPFWRIYNRSEPRIYPATNPPDLLP